MDKLAEVIDSRLLETPGWSSQVARQPHFAVHVPGWFFWLIVGMGVKIMADRIANAWNKIKAKNTSVMLQVADERKTEREKNAADIAELRAQIEADGLSDADRQAIAEMEAEAGGG